MAFYVSRQTTGFGPSEYAAAMKSLCAWDFEAGGVTVPVRAPGAITAFT
jgi:hypothetical protein